MTSILHQEIQKAIANAQYNRAFDDTEYDFSTVRCTLQSNPRLVNSTDKEGNTLLHILCQKLPDNNMVFGLEVENVLAFKPNPLIKNKAGYLPIDYLKEKSKPFETLKNYHKHYNQIACFTPQLFGKTHLSKEEQAFHDEITSSILSFEYNKCFDMPEHDFSRVHQLLQLNPKLIDTQDNHGNSVLHLFCQTASNSLVRGLDINGLLAFKPNPFLMNENGYLPINYLKNGSHEQQCLKRYQNHYKKSNIINLVFNNLMGRQNG